MFHNFILALLNFMSKNKENYNKINDNLHLNFRNLQPLTTVFLKSNFFLETKIVNLTIKNYQ